MACQNANCEPALGGQGASSNGQNSPRGHPPSTPQAVERSQIPTRRDTPDSQPPGGILFPTLGYPLSHLLKRGAFGRT